MSVVPFNKPSPPSSATGSAGGDTSPRKGTRKSRSENAATRGGTSRTTTTVTRRKTGIPAGKPSERKYLHSGMSEAEVLTRIGSPDVRSKGSHGGSRWSYLPHPDDPQTITTLTFANGVVNDIERRMVR